MKKTNKNFGEISKHIIKNQHLIITKHLYKNEDIDLGEQDKFTPIFDIERMCDFVFISNADVNENICVMYNLEILEYFFAMGLINKKYTFCYDSLNDYRFAKLLEKKYNVKNSIDYIDIRNMVINGKKNNPNRLDKIMANKHFDVIFTNPPYNRNKDQAFLKDLITNKVADRIVCVHPGAFLFGHNENNKVAEDLKNTNTLEEVTLFWGNEMFDTELKHAHCISVWDMNHNSDKVTIHDKAFTERKDIYNTDEFTYATNVNDVTVHSLVADKAAKLFKKFMNCDSILNHATITDDNKTEFGFKCSPFRRGMDYTKRNYGMFFSMIGNGQKAKDNAFIDDNFIWTGKNEAQGMRWYFNTEEERTNFFNYLKLKSTRFLLSLNKNVTDLTTGRVLRTVPWMDFTKHYSEEDLKKAWGIDEELWDYIDKFIPDYYEDYKEIAK